MSNSPWGSKKSDATEQLSAHTHIFIYCITLIIINDYKLNYEIYFLSGPMITLACKDF